MAVPLRIGKYFGAVGQQNDFPAAVVTEVAHLGERALPAHRHDVPYFGLLVRGGYVEEVEGRRLEYGPFSVGFHPPLTHRDWIGPAGAVFFFVEIRPAWLAAATELLPADPDFEPRLLDGDLSCLATQLYRLHVEEMLGPESVDSALWELIGCLWRGRRLAERGQPRWLASCLELLRGEFARPLTVLEVASAVDVHPVHLSREFRRRFGQTMGEYLHKLRIQAACKALEDPDSPLSDIALAAGFADHSHFCRVFKSRIGCSPGRFRELVSSS
jgi:AraC family transcriptional regulator